jgi:hypothetical protein
MEKNKFPSILNIMLSEKKSLHNIMHVCGIACC